MPGKSQSKNMKYDFDGKKPVFLGEDKKIDNSRVKKGIIYARVSTEEQKRKGNGINAQIIDCKRWAEREGVEVVEVFKDEAVTGTKLNRKGFIEAIRYLEKSNRKVHQVDYFICGATSRFSRSPKINESFDMVSRVELTGAKLVAVGNGGVQESETEEGMISLTLNFLVDALESKRAKKRSSYGYRGKIYEGLWPFPAVPLGYERVKEKAGGKEIKMLIKKEPEASILSEGLEKFASGVFLTKQQLFEFFDERGLKSNSKQNKTGKLHPSIVDRLLDMWKLYVYSGYLTYPDRGITDLIPAKHPAIISVDTLHKIMVRLNKDGKLTNHKIKKYDEDADEYPLKRILLCPECERGVTKRKSKSKTGDYHHYYGCNTKGCRLYKKSMRRDMVHEAVRERLAKITPSKAAVKLFEAIFKEEWDSSQKDMGLSNKEKSKTIKQLDSEMERIEKFLEAITSNDSYNDALFRKKQERRAELNQQKEDLEYEIEHIEFSNEEYNKTLNEAKTVIANPLAIRDLEDVELKQLLIRVCFNNKIYYKKNEGLHTPEISVIYLLLEQLPQSKSPNLNSSASVVNNIYDFIKKSKVRYARSLIQGYIKVTNDEEGIVSRLNEKQMIVYDLDGFEAATGIGRY